MVCKIEYPVKVEEEKVSVEEQAKFDAENFIRYAANKDEFATHDRIEIPIKRIWPLVASVYPSIPALRSVLLTIQPSSVSIAPKAYYNP